MKYKNWEDFYSYNVSREFLLENACVHRTLIQEVLKEKPTRVLEVGIGTGTMSIIFSLFGVRSIGIDNNKSIIEKAEETKKMFNADVMFKEADATSLPFDNNYFDVVFSQGFFEHFDDKKIIELLKEQLRVGKSVVFSVPNNFYSQQDFGDERLLSKEYWDLLLKNNFNVIYSTNYHEHSIEVKKFFRNKVERRLIMYLAKIS